MPGMNGVTLCEKIREQNKGAFIYALSGHVRKFGTETLERSGFDGFLVKPIDAVKLEKAMEGAFDKIARMESWGGGVYGKMAYWWWEIGDAIAGVICIYNIFFPV